MEQLAKLLVFEEQFFVDYQPLSVNNEYTQAGTPVAKDMAIFGLDCDGRRDSQIKISTLANHGSNKVAEN